MRKVWLALFIFVMVGSGIFAFQREIDARRGEYRAVEELLYISDPEAVRRLSLGFESLVADIYWVRAVQYYGGKRRDVPVQRYDLLEPLLEMATSLDPKMLSAYRFGATFLAEPQPLGAGLPERAIALLDKGIKYNPRAWQLYFDKGFVYIWHLNDFPSAGRTFLEGARLAGAPDWMETLAAYAMQQGGEFDVARQLWLKQYQEAENEKVRENAMNHLMSLKIDEDIWTLEYMVRLFSQRYGRLPQGLDELVRAGLIRNVPLDPSGKPYRLERETGRVVLAYDSTAPHFPLKFDYRERYWRKLEARLAEARGQ